MSSGGIVTEPRLLTILLKSVSDFLSPLSFKFQLLILILTGFAPSSGAMAIASLNLFCNSIFSSGSRRCFSCFNPIIYKTDRKDSQNNSKNYQI